jgi:ABC-type Fe3+-hydroxamate transport system substrate-binding protein
MFSMPSGNGHKSAIHFQQPPRRVVSLVPSLTESMFDLGLGDFLVGITDFCVYPAEGVAKLPHLGGPKTPRLEEILALQPDLVMANQEENPKEVVESLEAAGIKVWVTFPKTVRQAMDVLWTIVGLYKSRGAAIRLETLELTLDWAEEAVKERSPWRYFCPIWQSAPGEQPAWWMTFNQETYMHDLLRLLGGENIFARRVRRYPLEADLGVIEPEMPGERDKRYPHVTLAEIMSFDPAVILLPDEPFAFNADQRMHLEFQLAETQAVKHGRIFEIEGSLLTWHGTRLARALRDLPELLDI